MSITVRSARFCLLALWISTGMLITGCISTFSELQSARLTGVGRVTVTPGYSAVSRHDGKWTLEVDDRFGVQLATGIADRLDLCWRYERVVGNTDFNVMGFGPKVAVVPDRFAVYTPLGFAFGEELATDGIDDTLEFHPTAIFSRPFWQVVEVSASGKALIRQGDTLVAANFGLGFSSAFERWVLRQEIGFLWNPGQSGRHRHISLAFSYVLGK